MLAWLLKCLDIFTIKKKYESTKTSESAIEYYDHDSDISPQEVANYMKSGNIQSRRKSVCGDNYDPYSDTNVSPFITYPKTNEQKKKLTDVVSKILMFTSLDKEELQIVLDAMFEKRVRQGECIISEGDDGDNFYVIERGSFNVFINDKKTNAPALKGSYKDSGSFGELALLYNCPRQASIVATSQGSLWALDRKTFHRIVVKKSAQKRKEYENFLATVPLLSTLTDEERGRVADAMGTVQFSPKQCIIEQGGQGNRFYIVVKGHVNVKKKITEKSGKHKVVQLNRLGPGEYFGELALLTKQPRAASVFADDSVTCADVNGFERLMGPCKNVLSRNMQLYKTTLKSSNFELK